MKTVEHKKLQRTPNYKEIDKDRGSLAKKPVVIKQSPNEQPVPPRNYGDGREIDSKNVNSKVKYKIQRCNSMPVRNQTVDTDL